ncbi:uncharacterized protein LOC129721882 [Wyeomyia smithii]|uniref:uncharacterized protein LOC129721882 n=1 Tax=Wyeomyia smithii TaxID=174621 RepID=UPI0024681A43|nr:uncharacterized protein LOC129721882 [Wyeomyia smithii]
MKFLILSLLISFVAAGSIPYGNVPECAGKQLGAKVHVGNDCSKYAICQPVGLSFIQSCQAGLVYNINNDICDWPANVPGCGGRTNTVNDNYNWGQQNHNPQQQQWQWPTQETYYPQQWNQYPQQNYYPQQQYYPQYWYSAEKQ